MEILLRGVRWALYGFLFLFLVLALGNDPWEIEPSYRIDIQRNAATPEEAALIALAEAECPPYEDVVAADPSFRTAPLPPESDECLWWYDEFETLIPYAITAEAIAYYEEYVREAEQAQRNVNAGLTYEAHVEYGVPHPDVPGEEVRAVQMALSFDYYCGPLCGQWFTKTRTVLIDDDGVVISVEGDGETDFIVSK